MNQKSFIVTILITIFSTINAAGQFMGVGVGVYGPYLKSFIDIQYLQEPNKKPAEIQTLISDFIINRGSQLLFGTNSNDGMDRSAQLVDALFKSILITPSKSITKSAADVKFQETIYQALRLSGRKIQICFINDTKGITDEYLQEYRFYYKTVTVLGTTYKYVTPGVFKDQVYGRTIVIGESLIKHSSLEEVKKVLISLIVQLALEDYGPVKISLSLNDFTSDGNSVKVGYAQSDRRRIENQAIANAFLLYYSDKYKSEVFEWLQDGRVFYLPVVEADLVATSDEGARLPIQRYSLRDKYMGFNADDVGKPIPPISELVDQFTKNWVIYNSFEIKGDKTHDISYHYFQNDLYLGIFFYQFIRAFGISKFAEAILYDGKKILTVKPQLKTAFFIQNICLMMLGDKNVQYIKDNPGSVEAKNTIFPLAIFSFMSGLQFGSADAASFKKSLQTVTDASAIQSRGTFDEIVNLFTSAEQKKIATAFRSDDPADNDDGYILSKTARIARIIGIK